jgi:hypothetical protein
MMVNGIIIMTKSPTTTKTTQECRFLGSGVEGSVPNELGVIVILLVIMCWAY